MSDQLIDQAREHIARVWTEQGWRSEQALDGTGWDVWTLDATGQRRIIIARGCTPNVAGLLCFMSTALPQLCDRASATPSPWRPAVNAASNALGAWMSAALDDPAVCDAMKADTLAWFDAGQPVPSPWRLDRESIKQTLRGVVIAWGENSPGQFYDGPTLDAQVDAILTLSQSSSGGAELEALKVAARHLLSQDAEIASNHRYAYETGPLVEAARAYAASVEQGVGK